MISDAALIITSISSILGLVVTLTLFLFQQRKQHNLYKFNVYQNLEFEANNIFRFTAENNSKIESYLFTEKASQIDISPAFADNYIYQTLNLFELSISYRKDDLIDKEVFGSWVAWYYELLESWYFRENWDNIKLNYTPILRDIYDLPVSNYQIDCSPEERLLAFYDHVSKTIKCQHVKDWINNC